MINDKALDYYAWDSDGRCSDGYSSIEDAETEAIKCGYRYVVLGWPCESVEIVIDLDEDRTSEFGYSDVLDYFQQNA